MISLQHLADDEWNVTVQAATVTQHCVRVAKTDVARFAEGRSAEELLKASFEFLLDRESNTSILRSFDLPLIGNYFPEYEREIRARLAGKRA